MKLPPFALERFFARHEFAAKHILCASDCESMSIDELLALEPGASEAFRNLRLGYTDSQGSPSLRATIARISGSVEPGDILLTSGAEEAIFLFMHAALAPGDHLVVHQPCYQSLVQVARSIGCEVSGWEAREERAWVLDPDDLPRLRRRSTRAIVLNVPHNPTGFLMGRDEFLRTLEFAEAHGLLLFSDEVYRGLEQDPIDRLPTACAASPRAISLGVMSKTYGLPGLRIGWIATQNAALRARMAELKDYTTICASAPSEFLAEVALRHAEALERRSRTIIAGNLAILDGFFARHAEVFSWHRPKAGPIAFPRFLKGDAEELCRGARESRGVLLAPGKLFGGPAGNFRIGFGRRTMPEALGELEGFLES
ncbi:MAG: aminotransferase class I/II-fold pyridoxal phosphate-dependent enzyme [Spirochaetia bacterium]